MLHSEYIVYVDESGDHDLTQVSNEYPVFVLAFCAFEKRHYWTHCVPAVQRLKFDHFGHDMVVLHEREIRKALPPFQFLVNAQRREIFMQDLTELVESAEFTLIAAVIDKQRLQERYSSPASPYDLAVTFCLERLYYWLAEQGEKDRLVHVVFESRGRREDAALELEFRRVCGGANRASQRQLPFEPVFASKSINCTGLQLADLVARPIGRQVLDPSASNRAYEIIQKKFRRKGNRVVGRGLKIFP